MPLNAPQVSLQIDGQQVLGAVSLRLEQRAWLAAAQYEVEVALGEAPLCNAAWAAALQMASIDIGLSIGYGFVSFLTGQIDNVRIDFRNNVAVFTGRDLAARLIDMEIHETFNNQTAGQIAATLAERCGLTPNVAATTGAVGQYYEIDHARSALALHARATTAWNLLGQLAQVAGFDLSVTGSTLNFGPPQDAPPVVLSPCNFLSLDIDRATTVPAGATVTSWNSRNKAVVSQSAGAAGGIMIVRPNMTTEQAGSAAANHMAALNVHRVRLAGVMPGELGLVPPAQLYLTGTSSAFDGVYAVDAVSRRLDARHGFTQTVYGYALNS